MPSLSLRLRSELMEERILHSADIAPPLMAGTAAADTLVQQPLHAVSTDATVQRSEIVFVDAALPDAASLLADLQAQQRAGRPIEIVTIEAGQDGIALIGATLAARHDVSAVHVLAHGSDGVLQLGSATLDAQTLLRRAGEVAAWGQALTADADLLLYGCDVAQTAAGQHFVSDLAALTGADVAASTDLTGAAARGGNWTLEYHIGGIEATLAPSRWEQTQWQGVMATYTVTTTADVTGNTLLVGSLRWAISQANANAGTDTIVFAVNGNFSIAPGSTGGDDNKTGDFDITDSVNIVGNGSANTVVNGNGLDRVFDVRSGTVSLSGLTIKGGTNSKGGGIEVTTGAGLALSDAVVQNNIGSGNSKGGGIYSQGSLTLRRVVVQNNGNTTSGDTSGAGIYSDNGATLDARDVEIRGNIANGNQDGGGLYIGDNGSALLQNVTLAGNQAKRGGGLFNHGSATTLVNVTLSGNTATTQGGGLWADKSVTLDHVTIANNVAAFFSGGGVFDNGGVVTARNSLFAGNVGGNSNWWLVSKGYNLSDDFTAGLFAFGDQNGVAAGLSPLADNGGFTRTQAIGSGSAALDAANPVTTLTADQRGVAYYNGRADIGAYEANPNGFAPTIGTVSNQTIDEDATLAPVAFTIGDVETNAASLVVTATSSNTALVPNAAIVLGGSGNSRTVSLTPAANANSSANGGPTTITLSVSDGTNTTSTAFTVTVQAVNDAPTVALPTVQSVPEGTNLVFTGANAITVSDVDAGAASLQVTLTVAQGKLQLGNTSGLAFVVGNGNNDATMTFTGSLANIGAALNGMNYKPAGGYSGPDRLDIAVNDLGHSGSGGARTASGSVAITVTAVNQAPVLGLPGAQVTPLPMPLAFSATSGNAITVSDPDAGSAPLQITLSTANVYNNGNLSFGSLTNVTLVSGTGSNDATVVLRGSITNLNAALGTLTFAATAAGAARIDVGLDDLGNTGAGGALQASGAVAITVGNDAPPVLTLGNTTRTFTEGTGSIKLDPSLALTDADNATLASAQVRIGAGYAGAEDVVAFSNDGSTMGNIVSSYSAGVLTLASAGQTATVAQWQAALQTVTYANASTAPSTAPRTVTLTVNDGIADSATRLITLGVVAVNDAPVLTGANDLAPIAEDVLINAGSLVSTLIAGRVSDADNTGLAGIAVTSIDNSNGSWQYTTDGTNWFAFSGVSDNSALLLAADADTAVRFVPNANWNGTVAGGVRFRAWDQTVGSPGGVADASINGGSAAFSSATAASGITVTPVNDPPLLAQPIANQSATQGAAFSFTLPAGTFTDVDAGDTLSYSATLGSGAALPAWLSFDAATQTFSGTPANADVGSFNVRVTATDTSNASANGDFTLAVANVNDPPVLAQPIANQSATQNAAFAFTVPADTFTDVDVGDSLSYSATLASGAALPAWLTFDGATQSFSGTPGNADVGAINVRVTATDTSNASANGDFTLAVANVNDPPLLAQPIANQSATQGAAFSFTLPAGTFTDVDAGDTLSYSATLGSGAALPAWLSFDAATQTFSGTPANADVGSFNVRVTATDGSNASANGDFTLAVANVNDPPVLAQPIANQSATQGAAFGFSLPYGTFTDVDTGDSLSYSATLVSGAALPAWLTFDAATQTFSGTPANADVGAINVRVTATDTSNATAFGEFTLTVANVNDPPVLTAAIASQSATQGAAFAFAVPAGSFTDIDASDSLSYRATLSSGAALPSWLSFNAATQTFSGTPANADVGVITVRVTATDTSNASANGDFTLTVANVNDAPALAQQIANQSATQGAVFAFTLPSGTFTDIDAGDTLSYSAMLASGAALPSWLRFNATTQTFSGTPGNADVGAVTVRVTATDTSNATVFGDFTLTVVNTNDAPELAQPIADQAATQGAAFTFAVPAGTFTDVDAGDTLAYRATLTSGAALPAWLTFNAATQTFSGTPANADVGAITLRVTATDKSNATATGDFTLTVANVNDAPVLAQPIGDRGVITGTSARFQLPAATFTDPDVGDTLHYAAALADGAALPAWLTFDASTLAFTAAPAADQTGAFVVRVTATDNSGAAAQALFAVVVTSPTLPAPPAAADAGVAPAPPPPAGPPAVAVAATAPAAQRASAPAPVATPVADALAPAMTFDSLSEAPQQRGSAAVADSNASRPGSRSDAVLANAIMPEYREIELGSLVNLLKNDDVLRRLEETQRHMLEQGLERRTVVASAIAATSGLSVGYVIWLVRGGVLVSSMLSALPAWQMIDPLPVVAAAGAARTRRSKTGADDGDVERLFDEHRKPSTAPAPAPTADAAAANKTGPKETRR